MNYSDLNDGMMSREDLMKHLEENTQVFKVDVVKAAFKAVDRAGFLTEEYRPEAYEDYAVPIGFKQIMTKPTVAAFMLELLDVVPGNTILEVGTGSGWITALLAHLVGSKGKVWGTEFLPELVKLSKENLKKHDIKNVEIIQATKTIGLRQSFLYDRILVTGAADEDSVEDLIGQLAVGGIMVVPTENSLVQIKKTAAKTTRKEFPGFEFEPLA